MIECTKTAQSFWGCRKTMRECFANCKVQYVTNNLNLYFVRRALQNADFLIAYSIHGRCVVTLSTVSEFLSTVNGFIEHH